MNEQFHSLILSAGFSEDSYICFEKLTDLIEKGLVSENDLYPIKNPIDRFDFINSFTIRTIMTFIESGVEFLSLDSLVISPFAKIAKGTLIHPGCEIRKNVTIGENCVIGRGCVIEESVIGNNCTIESSHISSSLIEENVSIGPYSRIRNNSHVHSGVKIGNFVEVKNSTLGRNTKAAHLTYIGDSNVGCNVNFGCGTVTCNYDGFKKYRTIIGDNAFIGCNSNLIAPVIIGEGAYIAAGSTITDSVPEDSLAIGRAREVIKENWASEFRKKHEE